MIPVTQSFLDAVRNSIDFSVEATLYNGTVPITSAVKISGGSVSCDRDQNVRRTLNCTIVLENWEDAPLNIIISRIEIWLGFYAGALKYEVPVGTFRVETMQRTNGGAIAIKASSFESYVVDHVFSGHTEEPAYYDRGRSAIWAIKDLIISSFPEAVFETDPRITDVNLAERMMLPAKKTYWEAVEALADLLTADVYCTAYGRFRIAPRPTFENTAPVFKINEGPDGVLVELGTSIDRSTVYNGVLASYQSSSGGSSGISPVSWIEVDDDPASATYWGGDFGKRMLILDASPLLTTKALCKAKAKLVLSRVKFAERELNLTAVPNPALEPDDIVMVTMLDGTVENHMLSSLTIPLQPGTWLAKTISTRVKAGIGPDDPLPPPPEVPLPDPPDDDFNPDAQKVYEESAGGASVTPSVPPADPGGLPPDTSAGITAATYNLYAPGTAADKQADVQNLLKMPKVSVLALQEDDIATETAAEAAAAGWSVYQPTPAGEPGPVVTPILWDPAVWNVLGRGTYRLSDRADLATSGPTSLFEEAKYLVWVRLQNATTQRIWTFASSQLVNDPGVSASRLKLWGKQETRLASYSRTFTTNKSRAVLLGGYQQPPTFSGFDTMRSTGAFSASSPSRASGAELDYAWVQNATAVDAYSLTSGFRTQFYPVVMEFKS